MNNNNNSNWTQDPSVQKTAKLPSGRSAKNVKQDAKKLKKEKNISHHDALEIVADKNGLACLWNDFVLRAKEILGSKSNHVEMQEYAKRTYILGDTGTGKDRAALQQLISNNTKDQYINDWVIDVKGDTTMLWALGSIAQQYFPDKKLNVLNHINRMNNKSTQLFNLLDNNERERNLVISSLFENEKHQLIILTLLAEIDSDDPFNVLLEKIENLPIDLLSESEKKDISEKINLCIETLLSDVVGTKDNRAWSANDLFSPDSVNMVLFPCLEKSPYVMTFLTNFYLKFLTKKINHSKDKKFRVTILGLSGREDALPEFLSELRDNDNVELIISSHYSPALDESFNPNKKISEFDIAYCLRSSDYIPEYIRCLESIIRKLSFGEVVVLRNGKFSGNAEKLPYLEIKDLEKLEFFHANGDRIG